MMRAKTRNAQRGPGGRGPAGNRSPYGTAMTAVAVLMLAAGLVALYWSDIAGFASQVSFNREIAAIERVHGEIARAADASPSVSADSDLPGRWDQLLADGALSEEAAAYIAELPRFEAYNESLRAAGGQRLDDPFGADDAQRPFAASGIGDDLVGTVSVPSIGCSLPLYFGATSEKMAKGAAVVAGTSLPLGQVDSNCVIAAHRGYAQAAMFRDIEDVRLGDAVVITTPWDRLTYRAVAFKVIDPDDVSSVLIQPGRDLVTLLTCHPYGSNATRYLVICERDESGGAAVAEGAVPDGAAFDAQGSASGGYGSPVLRIERLAKAVVTFALAAVIVLIVAFRLRRKARKR